MPTWVTTYGTEQTDGQPGRVDLDRLNVLIVGITRTGGYYLEGQHDDYGQLLYLSNRSAPFATLAGAEAAAAALIDTDVWVRYYGSYGSAGVGWIRPAAILAVETLPVPGGHCLVGRADVHGYLWDLSDRAAPFPTVVDAVTAMDALIGGLP